LAALTVYAQHAGADLGRAVAGCPHLAGLRALHLARNRLGDGGAAALGRSAGLTKLETLDLSENELSECGARALAGSAAWPGLRELDLAHNPLGPGGAEAVAGRFGSLRRLGLSGTGLGGRLHSRHGAADLLRVPAVDLSANGLTPADVKALLSCGPVGAAALDLGHNDLGDEGVRVLAACPGLAGVASLRLAGCNISDEAAGVLAGSPHLARLESLDLGNNPVGDRGFRAFLGTPHLRALRRLVVPGVGVSPRVRAALAERFRNGVVRF
ncbi:MAG: hypothetical protein K2X82_16550, partial [Gemmataceae bacterium]|nr:hypothetical protein [Gemmataceae bacterium]